MATFRLSALTLFVALVLGAVSFAQDTLSPFARAFARYEKGEDVTADMTAVMKDEKADVKDRFNAAYVLAVIALARGAADDAITDLDRAENLRANQPQIAIRRAEALTLKKDWKEAQKSLDRAAKALMGKKPDLSVRLGLAQAGLDLAQGMAEKATQRLEALSKTAKDEWQVYFDLARAYEALDKPKEAVLNYERVIALDPKTDPFPGVIAYQRAAALSISSDGSSYGKVELAKVAVERYEIFMARAAKNGVAQALIDQTAQAIDVLKNYVLARGKK